MPRGCAIQLHFWPFFILVFIFGFGCFVIWTAFNVDECIFGWGSNVVCIWIWSTFWLKRAKIWLDATIGSIWAMSYLGNRYLAIGSAALGDTFVLECGVAKCSSYNCCFDSTLLFRYMWRPGVEAKNYGNARWNQISSSQQVTWYKEAKEPKF